MIILAKNGQLITHQIIKLYARGGNECADSKSNEISMGKMLISITGNQFDFFVKNKPEL